MPDGYVVRFEKKISVPNRRISAMQVAHRNYNFVYSFFFLFILSFCVDKHKNLMYDPE